MKKKETKRIIPVFLMPLLVIFIVFQLYPVMLNLFYSLLNWDGMTKQANFIGMSNYQEILKDGLFWNALKNSLLFAILGTFFQISVSFCLAYFVEFNVFRLKKGIRLIFMIPIVATPATIGIIMKSIFSHDGIINMLLTKSGFSGINWLADPKWSFVMIILVSVWKETGLLFIYWMASFKLVSPAVLDAAKIDGATGMSLLKKIVFPIIKPIFLLVSMITFLNSLKIFDQIQTLTAGGPFFSTDMMSTYIYRTAFSSSFGTPRLSYASTAAVLCLIFVAALGYLGRFVVPKYKGRRR